MLNFAKLQESSEVIGMAALESMALGVPMIIESKLFTTFRNLPGAIERNPFFFENA